MSARKVDRDPTPHGRWIVGELHPGTRKVHVFSRYSSEGAARWHLADLPPGTHGARRVVLDSHTLEVEFRVTGDHWCPKWMRTAEISPKGFCSECSDQHGEIPKP